MKDKAEERKLEREKERLIRKIVKRKNRLLLDTYRDIKKILEINAKIKNKESIFNLAGRIGYNPQWVYYILALDSLKNKIWLKKIETNIILYILNFSNKTVEKQNEIFGKIAEMDLDGVKRLLYQEYAAGTEVAKDEPEKTVPVRKNKNFVYPRVKRDLERLNISIHLISKLAKFTPKEKEKLRKLCEELSRNLKKVLKSGIFKKK